MRRTASPPGIAPVQPATAAPPGAAAAPVGGGWAGLGLAVAAGLALAAAFPPLGLWPLAVAGPGLLVLALWGRGRVQSFGLSLACGAAFFLPLLSWLVNLAWYVWAALATVETLIFAVLALALRPLLRLRAWPLGVAGWWVAAEGVRSRWPWGGFPWGRLAMSQPAAPTAGWAAVGGPPLLTFLLALTGACVAWLGLAAAGRTGWRGGTGRPGGTRLPGRTAGRPAIAAGADGGTWRAHWLAAAVLTAAVAAVAAGGNLLLGLAGGGTGPGGAASRGAAHGTAVVATVQGNVPHTRNLPNLLRETTVTANHARATIAFARQVRAGLRAAPAVLIWPENSTDADPAQSPLAYATIAAAVNSIGRPVLVGAVLQNPQRNSGQLWLPGRGPVGQYVKRQLVPFGEVIPFRGFLEHFTSLPELQPRNFTPGHHAVVFRLGRIRLGDVICYEVGFDNLVRSEVRAGANMLAVQTNDADFELDGQLGETLQQLDMARMAAITTGRSVAVASTTGVSAIIAPDGALIARSGTWRPAVLEARVPLRSGLTLADRAGSWPELAIIAAVVLALVWAVLPGLAGWPRRSRRARAAADNPAAS